jgi:hypothetical protein
MKKRMVEIKATAVDAYITYCCRLDSLVSAWFTAAPNADAAQIADRMARKRCRRRRPRRSFIAKGSFQRRM